MTDTPDGRIYILSPLEDEIEERLRAAVEEAWSDAFGEGPADFIGITGLVEKQDPS